MKAVILAGGLGTRLSEETTLRPKPMVEIGGKPILWHIMKGYSAHGIHEFVICCGYRGYQIKEYFANYYLHISDLTFDIQNDCTTIHSRNAEPWKVTLVDTGDETLTGGRLRRVRRFIENDPSFCFTYGDGVADVDIREALRFHDGHGKLCTVTATQPSGRFGALSLEGSQVIGFREKPQGDGAWVNAGFFVLSPKVIDYIEGDYVSWEREPIAKLAGQGEVQAFFHRGFWQPMDTLRDKIYLEELWSSGKAPWRTW
jgi:glucose-1-phosphate cytidylyltransferase